MSKTVVSDTLVANDPRCDFCLLTSSSNKAGVPEDLLFCKDCQAKGEARVEADVLFVVSYYVTFLVY